MCIAFFFSSDAGYSRSPQHSAPWLRAGQCWAETSRYLCVCSNWQWQNPGLRSTNRTGIFLLRPRYSYLVILSIYNLIEQPHHTNFPQNLCHLNNEYIVNIKAIIKMMCCELILDALRITDLQADRWLSYLDQTFESENENFIPSDFEAPRPASDSCSGGVTSTGFSGAGAPRVSSVHKRDKLEGEYNYKLEAHGQCFLKSKWFWFLL